MNAMQAQADEKSQVLVGSVKQSRLEVESAYRDLVDKVKWWLPTKAMRPMLPSSIT